MSYVDGFIIPIPKKNLAAYRKIAATCSKIWMDHGATSYVETVGDDVPKGKLTSFPRSVMLKPSEVVIFSWITYPSKKVRDRCNKAVMEDPRMKKIMAKMITFDGKRLIYGGFKSIVER
ncbi:MAG: DUF1428 domain-containing protein [Kofleriaceae bacterium]